MDEFKIQALISQNKVARLDQVDPDNTYVQVGIYQKGNQKRRSGNANVYPPAAMSLSEVRKAFKYEIGQDVPEEGGVIAHRWLSTTPGGYPQSGNIQNYLVVGYKDLNTNAYSNITTGIGVTAQSVWDGQSNTNAIVAQVGATSGAAYSCANLVDQGKSDWYLPAIQELLKIWDNYLDISQGLESTGANPLLLTNIYWSSTETNGSPTTAWVFRTPTNGVQSIAKNTTNSVRPVRKFSI